MSLSSKSLGEFSCFGKGMASINSAAVDSILRINDNWSSSFFSSVLFKSFSPNHKQQFQISSIIYYCIYKKVDISIDNQIINSK